MDVVDPDQTAVSLAAAASADSADSVASSSAESIEFDAFSSNPSFARLLAVIDYLKQRSTQPDGVPWTRDVLPDWVANVLAKLRARDTPPPVKWFIAKLITQRHKIFEVWSHHFFGPLVRCCFHCPYFSLHVSLAFF